LEVRFRADTSRLLHDRKKGDVLLVALSGGLDSTVLLQLLTRSAKELGIRVAAAHLDHAMRPDSSDDAEWVEDLCREWNVDLLVRRLDDPPAGETEARKRRHEFLREARQESGARYLATGHHADDQAETVLFRVLRGTGPAGLAGIRPRTADGVVRPLLDFWREELAGYARDHDIAWREDPTNESLGISRNRLRHEILPLVEREIAPGARRALVRLSRIATAEMGADGLDNGPDVVLSSVESPGAVDVARPVFLRYDAAARARVLRDLMRRLGVVPTEAGTRLAVEFITKAPSGREIHLPNGVRIRRDLDLIRLERPPPSTVDIPLRIDPNLAIPFEGLARIGGFLWRVRAEVDSRGEPFEDDSRARLPRRLLLVGGWMPGARIRTASGTKKLKSLFLERRIPPGARHSIPVVTDEAGAVLWVPGLIRAEGSDPGAEGDALYLSITND